MSRTKGACYERELAREAREAGVPADRTAQLQAHGARIEGAPDVTLYDWPELHVEAKRDERLSVDAMVRQADDEAEGKVPVVVYRRSRQPSRAVVRWDWLLGLLAEVDTYRKGASS